MFKRFFDLLKPINDFLITIKHKHTELSNPLWIIKLAFLVDITTQLNILNTSLQGTNKFIIDSFDQVNNFIIKLNLYINEIDNKQFFHLTNTNKIYRKLNNR